MDAILINKLINSQSQKISYFREMSCDMRYCIWKTSHVPLLMLEIQHFMFFQKNWIYNQREIITEHPEAAEVHAYETDRYHRRQLVSCIFPLYTSTPRADRALQSRSALWLKLAVVNTVDV